MSPVVDVHCHLFNAADLPIHGFVKYVGLHGDPGSAALADLADRILRGGTQTWAQDMARVNSLFAPPTMYIANAPIGPHPSVLIDADAERAFHQIYAQNPELLARVAGAMGQLDETGPVGDAGLRETVTFNPIDIGDAVRRAVRWATLFTRSRIDLVADYLRTFDGKIGLAIPMMVDLGTGLGDEARTTIRQQVVLFEKISRASMLRLIPGVPDMQLHPFVGFDPLRELHERRTNPIETPLDVVKDAVLKFGFVGVKVYPQMGWAPSGNQPRDGLSAEDCATLDGIVDELAAWCVQQDVPITAHCNDSNYASKGYSGMGRPAQWVQVLKRHEGLHLNLGHFGGAHDKASDYSWPKAIVAALPDHLSLYADVACHRVDETAVVSSYKEFLRDTAAAPNGEIVKDRLMFGTDWYMEAINPDAGAFLKTYEGIVSDALGGDDLQAFLSGNALKFLGFSDPGNQNAQRLYGRYQRFAPEHVPDWLAH